MRPEYIMCSDDVNESQSKRWAEASWWFGVSRHYVNFFFYSLSLSYFPLSLVSTTLHLYVRTLHRIQPLYIHIYIFFNLQGRFYNIISFSVGERHGLARRNMIKAIAEDNDVTFGWRSLRSLVTLRSSKASLPTLRVSVEALALPCIPHTSCSS